MSLHSTIFERKTNKMFFKRISRKSQISNSEEYNQRGETFAKFFISDWNNHLELKNLKILEWACGTGVVTKHLPSYLDKSNRIYGFETDEKTIEWCKHNIKGVSFDTNNYNTRVSCPSERFDVIFSLYDFSKITPSDRQSWANELVRLLAPNGIFYLLVEEQKRNSNPFCNSPKNSSQKWTKMPLYYLYELFSNVKLKEKKRLPATLENGIQSLFIFQKQ